MVGKKLEERVGGVEGGEWMTGMEERVRKLEKEGECGIKGGEREGMERMVERTRDRERKMERREREERKNNILVRGLKVGKRNIRAGIEKVIKDIGVEVSIVGMRQIKTRKEQ